LKVKRNIVGWRWALILEFALMNKNERIGFRIPADIKKALMQIAKAEGRSLAQVCEVFLRAGISSYKKESSTFFKKFIQLGDRGISRDG
jgi:hypothetical protein